MPNQHFMSIFISVFGCKINQMYIMAYVLNLKCSLA